MHSLLRKINYQLNWAKATNRRPLRISLGTLEWAQFEALQKDVPTAPCVGPATLFNLPLIKAEKTDSHVIVELEPMQ